MQLLLAGQVLNGSAAQPLSLARCQKLVLVVLHGILHALVLQY